MAVGCAATPAADGYADGVETERPPTPSFRMLAERPADAGAGALIRRDDLVAPVGSERVYAVLDGPRSGMRIVQRTSAAADGGRVVAETLLPADERASGPASERPSERLVLAARGDELVLVEVDTPEEDSKSRFAEGLALAPDALRAGAPRAAASSMRVERLSDGGTRATGRAERSMRLRGLAEIELSGERLEAAVVEVVFSASLDAARVRRTSELFVVPGRGVVAERWEERLVVLGIFPKSTRETVALAPPLATERPR